MKKNNKVKTPWLAKYIWSKDFLITLILSIMFIGFCAALGLLIPKLSNDIIFLIGVLIFILGVIISVFIVKSILKAVLKRGEQMYGIEKLK